LFLGLERCVKINGYSLKFNRTGSACARGALPSLGMETIALVLTIVPSAEFAAARSPLIKLDIWPDSGPNVKLGT
jgi:hypothetical protein